MIGGFRREKREVKTIIPHPMILIMIGIPEVVVGIAVVRIGIQIGKLYNLAFSIQA